MQIGRWTVRRFRACPALRALFWVSQTVLSLMPEISLAREGSEGGGGGGGELLKQTGEATDPRLHTPQRWLEIRDCTRRSAHSTTSSLPTHCFMFNDAIEREREKFLLTIKSESGALLSWPLRTLRLLPGGYSRYHVPDATSQTLFQILIRLKTSTISRPARCTRGAVDRFGIPNPRKSG